MPGNRPGLNTLPVELDSEYVRLRKSVRSPLNILAFKQILDKVSYILQRFFLRRSGTFKAAWYVEYPFLF